MGRLRILVVAPHCDDETLGLGGTIARRADENCDVVVAVLTGHGEQQAHPLGPRSIWDTVRSEAREAFEILGVKETVFRDIPAVMIADLPGWQLNKITQELLADVAPDILYVPFLNDMHRDHRELFHSFSVAWRPTTAVGTQVKEIYCYEVPSETHWNMAYTEAGFLPNVWVDISGTLHRKLDALACFKSQLQPDPQPRSLQAVRALAQWRGSQMSVHAAEAFVLVRSIS